MRLDRMNQERRDHSIPQDWQNPAEHVRPTPQDVSSMGGYAVLLMRAWAQL